LLHDGLQNAELSLGLGFLVDPTVYWEETWDVAIPTAHADVLLD